MKNDLKYKISSEWAFPMTHQVKNLPATQEAQETWVRSLGWEDPLEKGTATHSGILAWRILWTEDTEVTKNKFLRLTWWLRQ